MSEATNPPQDHRCALYLWPSPERILPGIRRHTRGVIEVLWSIAALTKLHDELTLCGQLLHPAVLPVRYIDVILGVNVNAPWHIEFTRPSAQLATARQRLAILAKYLEAMVAAVHDIQIVAAITRQTSRPIQLTHARTGCASVARNCRLVKDRKCD